MSLPTGLLHDDESNLTFEWLGSADEARQLWFEVFAMRSYAKFGILQRALAAHSRVLLLDVGANLGLFSMFACQMAHQCACESVRVVAVEPIDVVCEPLRRNLAMCDAVRQFHVINSAVVDRATCVDGVSEIVFFPNMPGESTRHRREVERMQRRARDRVEDAIVKQCHLTTISQLINDFDAVKGNENERVVVKIDVEGDELLVLDGIDDGQWHRIVAMFLEVHDVDDRLARVVERLQRAEFDAICVEQQTSVETDDYALTIDPKLRLFYVFAERTPTF